MRFSLPLSGKEFYFIDQIYLWEGNMLKSLKAATEKAADMIRMERRGA